MKKPNKGTIIFISIIAVIVLLLVVSLKKPAAKNSPSDMQASAISMVEGQRSDFIAQILLEGEITSVGKTYNQEWLLTTINSLKDNPKNKAIALFINSPGGAVYEADEVYLALKDYKNAGKLIYVYQGSMAASGGYYISCAANQIYANRNTLTGSIGVIAGQSLDLTELFKRYGIKSETIHAGANKNMGNYNEPLTDEQRAILQSIADECYDQFTQIVSQERGIKIEDVRKLADGRIYTAKQALELKLIDKISNLQEMLDELKLAVGNQNISVVKFEVPKKKDNFLELLGNLSSMAESSLNEQTALPYIPKKIKEELDSPVTVPSYIYR